MRKPKVITHADVQREMIAANQLLRSFSDVVARNGQNTNWDALRSALNAALERQFPIINAIREEL